MLRNVSKLDFWDKIGHTKSVGFRFIQLFDELIRRRKNYYFGFPGV